MAKECYGKMFPPMDPQAVNRPVRGAVFGYEIVSHGLHSQGHRVLVDDEQWQLRGVPGTGAVLRTLPGPGLHGTGPGRAVNPDPSHRGG